MFNFVSPEKKQPANNANISSPFRIVQCGHCGTALVGEIKKNRYVYYHCTHYRANCGEPYVREEKLELEFIQLLRRLHFPEQNLSWVMEALKRSHADERRDQEERLQRLRREHEKAQRKLHLLYEDRLNETIEKEFFDEKYLELRKEIARLENEIQRTNSADRRYIDQGLLLLDVAHRAAEMFEKKEATEKRRLLNFVVSNAEWKNDQ